MCVRSCACVFASVLLSFKCVYKHWVNSLDFTVGCPCIRQIVKLLYTSTCSNRYFPNSVPPSATTNIFVSLPVKLTVPWSIQSRIPPNNEPNEAHSLHNTRGSAQRVLNVFSPLPLFQPGSTWVCLSRRPTNSATRSASTTRTSRGRSWDPTSSSSPRPSSCPRTTSGVSRSSMVSASSCLSVYLSVYEAINHSTCI